MIYVDYFFEVGANGNMALDRDLTLKQLGWNQGDQFEVLVRNDRIVLKRIKVVEEIANDSVPPIPVY